MNLLIFVSFFGHLSHIEEVSKKKDESFVRSTKKNNFTTKHYII